MTQIGNIPPVSPWTHTAADLGTTNASSPPAAADHDVQHADGDARNEPSADKPAASAGDATKNKQAESAKAIREQIERMQQQLAELMAHLQAVRAGHTDERQKSAMLGALETQIAMLQSSIMVATMKLAEAIANEGGKILDSTGGNPPASRT